MKTIGIGIDIVNNKRIKSSIKNNKFINRIFGKMEISSSKKIINKTNYLSKDELKELCPLAFAKEATNPKVSGRYLFVNTETIIDDLEKLGWLPVLGAQRKSRNKS